MPYIPPEDRSRAELLPDTAGELNYAISRLVHSYLGNDYSYVNLNEVIGVLECAKLELYRRVCAPYETMKMIANGDVYQEALQ